MTIWIIVLFLILPGLISAGLAKMYKQSIFEWLMWVFILGPLAIIIQVLVIWRKKRHSQK